MATPGLGPVKIRRAIVADQDAIFELVPRLVAFGPPAWREPATMSVTDRKIIGAALRSLVDDPIVLVAVSTSNIIMGFLHLHSVVDYYTERRNGHVADIVVAERYEGRGIGRQLLAAAEDWARAQRYEWLTISVFHENARAMRTYDQMGFKPDIARLLKPLR
jgi:ribosomal protein S18 acetylase RimI-like enzyme